MCGGGGGGGALASLRWIGLWLGSVWGQIPTGWRDDLSRGSSGFPSEAQTEESLN